MSKQKESNSGIYQLNPKKEINKQSKSKVVYTLYGFHHELNREIVEDKLKGEVILEYPVLINVDTNKDKLAYAVKETINNNTIFLVKIDKQDNLFNPINLTPTQAASFIKVNENCFNQYKEFLKTKNTLHLKWAEQART